MLRTGKEHLETLRDGRVVYIGSERVDDVTRHPAFAGAAGDRKSTASLAVGDDRATVAEPDDLRALAQLDHDAAAARPHDPREVHAFLACEPLRRGSGADGLRRGRRRRGRGRRRRS